MQAGRGMWHGGGLDHAGRTRGFQLWIALPPTLELGPSSSIYQAAEDVPHDGPVRVLLGSYGSASSAIVSPSPINYLAVRLKAGERWRYDPPTAHTVLWTAVASGIVSVPDELQNGDLAAFEQSNEGIEFEAFRYVTGSIEVVSGAALLVPSVAPFGALVLVPTMVGAVATHLFIVGGSAVPATVLLIGSLAIAWARRDQLTSVLLNIR